jgi:hypothetical protein
VLTSVRGSWVNWVERFEVFDELKQAIGCSAEGRFLIVTEMAEGANASKMGKE